MNKPDYRIDYTDIALEVYEMAMWKGYKFLKGRTLDAWLQYSWSILFGRKMTDHDLEVLQRFISRKKNIDLKIKCNEVNIKRNGKLCILVLQYVIYP